MGLTLFPADLQLTGEGLYLFIGKAFYPGLLNTF